MTLAVEAEQLVKEYRTPEGAAVRVLDVERLSLPEAGELAVSGPSGSGKSTLFNLVAGLLLPTSGSLRVLGTRVAELSEACRDQFRARNIGYIFQTSNLLGGFSALENVLLAMGFAGSVPAGERRRRAEELLDRVGLADRRSYRPGQLSSGQQQRVAVARALANRPALVLADEPTAHLDAASGRAVAELLRACCVETKAALLLASHDPALLETFREVASLRREPADPR